MNDRRQERLHLPGAGAGAGAGADGRTEGGANVGADVGPNVDTISRCAKKVGAEDAGRSNEAC